MTDSGREREVISFDLRPQVDDGESLMIKGWEGGVERVERQEGGSPHSEDTGPSRPGTGGHQA